MCKSIGYTLHCTVGAYIEVIFTVCVTGDCTMGRVALSWQWAKCLNEAKDCKRMSLQHSHTHTVSLSCIPAMLCDGKLVFCIIRLTDAVCDAGARCTTSDSVVANTATVIACILQLRRRSCLEWRPPRATVHARTAGQQRMRCKSATPVPGVKSGAPWRSNQGTCQ